MLLLAGGGWALAAAPALAQPASPPTAAPGLAITNFPAKKTLKVTSPAFKDGGDIPLENTQYRGNVFPGLAWGKGPYGTRTFAIVMQDADVNFRGGPLLHWSMYAIPGGVTKLAAGMTAPPAGASYGPNVRGPNHAYMGPHTPPGPKHHYHFAVFALDREIAVDPALSWDQLAADMSGHVLASGEIVGLGHADPDAQPPKPMGAAPGTTGR
ncbi:MAG TPA: YbhB/YbcL family Raf kinase inhibitor-like protein [Caulobacteraceae bacterium]|nr:YbhB/YbcL family Raf kinase inhibitor-like protein [Caulobacteraceae bacterium]